MLTPPDCNTCAHDALAAKVDPLLREGYMPCAVCPAPERPAWRPITTPGPLPEPPPSRWLVAAQWLLVAVAVGAVLASIFGAPKP